MRKKQELKEIVLSIRLFQYPLRISLCIIRAQQLVYGDIHDITLFFRFQV